MLSSSSATSTRLVSAAAAAAVTGAAVYRVPRRAVEFAAGLVDRPEGATGGLGAKGVAAARGAAAVGARAGWFRCARCRRARIRDRPRTRPLRWAAAP